MRVGRPRGRLLRFAPGYNPNSSSLGVDVSFLLFGTMAVTALTLITGAALRLWGPDQPPRDRADPPRAPEDPP